MVRILGHSGKVVFREIVICREIVLVPRGSKYPRFSGL